MDVEYELEIAILLKYIYSIVLKYVEYMLELWEWCISRLHYADLEFIKIKINYKNKLIVRIIEF